MNVMITYKHMDSSEGIKNIITEKSQKFQKYFHKDLTAKWTCWVDSDGHHSEVELTGHGGAPLFASAKADNLYKTIDEVVQKVSRQARKKLTREHNQIIHPNF